MHLVAIVLNVGISTIQSIYCLALDTCSNNCNLCTNGFVRNNATSTWNCLSKNTVEKIEPNQWFLWADIASCTSLQPNDNVDDC
ncbi:uncharacterized protein BDZ99DRAFT_276009 [Mytilinidion resinicola]|uniref:Secreted protein n=1 Tax=Mytilinidion resinicola TaxID=574789 RepID=A0A6A6YSI5_9PEZI|nr:uncharacterized protein BDZ99DRAFT_276009 [Mytilinidion resinicola]KAF2811469.1 hypothetical protein BDZ99DRAFT_276009 [Mytilinidion resinicola]